MIPPLLSPIVTPLLIFLAQDSTLTSPNNQGGSSAVVESLLTHWNLLGKFELHQLQEVLDTAKEIADFLTDTSNTEESSTESARPDSLEKTNFAYPNPHRRIEYSRIFRRLDFDASGCTEKVYVEGTFTQRGLLGFHKIWKLVAREYSDAVTYSEFFLMMHLADLLTSGVIRGACESVRRVFEETGGLPKGCGCGQIGRKYRRQYT